MANEPTYAELFRATQRTAVHLEMRDGYMKDAEFTAWLAGERTFKSGPGNPWFDLVSATVARGVEIRRARIVSEPISDYIRFEHEITSGHNVKAGEQVRWLPRRQATGLAVPGNDFWLFDETTLFVNHFDGNGESMGGELVTDPGTIRLCASSFEAVWDLAIPHEDYRPS